MDKLLYSITETADILGISRPMVYKLINTDESFPAFKIGRRTMVNATALIMWIANRTEVA